MDPVRQQSALIEALRDPDRYPHPVNRVEHRETHISHVLLAGEFAYKIKKPLNLGFLDFSDRERRRFYCEEEVRLNGRLAPGIYLDVVPITGTHTDPQVGGNGDAIEFAVRMRRFDDDLLLDRQLAAGRVDATVIEELARQVAAFHRHAPIATADGPYGTPEAVLAPMIENFDQIEPRLGGHDHGRVLRLRAWTEERIGLLEPALKSRLTQGRIRECHGDMHLRNMVFIDGQVEMFDGIEFDPELRWIDVASDVAFAVMDLDCRNATDLAGRLLDAWLAGTGDYAALDVLRPYLVYRAMVRAKITAIRLGQRLDPDEQARSAGEFRDYLALAERYADAHAPALLLTFGEAGTGKSTAAMRLVEQIGAVRLRSDVERLRLYPDAPPHIRYGQAASDAVHERLERLAGTILQAGFPVIVDATFTEARRRAPFMHLAAGLGVPFHILEMRVSPEVRDERIRARSAAGSDVSEADTRIARDQVEKRDPLTLDERRGAIVVDNNGPAPVIPETGLGHGRLAPAAATTIDG